MKNVLITGGAGFVGSNLASLLLDHGCNVTILEDLFTGELANIAGLGVEFIEGTILNRELVRRSVRGIDTIFHLAARNIIISRQKPREDMAVNIEGTFNVLEAAVEGGVEKVVYTSTSSIYGNARILPTPESEPPNFLNYYSVSKYAGENYCLAFYEMHNLPVAVVRYSNLYGPKQSPSNPYCGVVGKFINNPHPIIHGDGEQTRDFTYVADACRATILTALSPESSGEVYNIGTGVETSINELARKLSPEGAEIKYTDHRDIDNIRRRAVDITKIRDHLKFCPDYNLNAGLKKTVSGMGEVVEE